MSFSKFQRGVVLAALLTGPSIAQSVPTASTPASPTNHSIGLQSESAPRRAASDETSVSAESFFIVEPQAQCQPGDPACTPIPEPGTLMLLSLGLIGLGMSRRAKVVRG